MQEMLNKMKTEMITSRVVFEDSQVIFQMEELSLVREYYLTLKLLWPCWNFVLRPLYRVEEKDSPGKGLHGYVKKVNYYSLMKANQFEKQEHHHPLPPPF